MSKIFGNDRSHWNGLSNFATAYANGARFDIAKSSEGTGFLDGTFVANYTGARARYQVAGAYHYFHPAHSVTEQINNVQKGLARVDFDKRSILAVDVETTDGLANSITSSRLKTFMKKLREVYPENPMMIYTGPYIWSQVGNSDPYWLNFALWEANTGVKEPTPIQPWGSNWAIWQFSHTGHGPSWGASSAVIDVNIMAQWCWDFLVDQEQEPEAPGLCTINELVINGIKYTGELTLAP